MQNEEPSAHVPFLQRPEQQPPAPPSGAVHGLPAVRQVLLSGWHFPPVQLPLQQPDELVQVAMSAMQLVALAQRPRAASHCRLQQSVFTAQELPEGPQVVSREVQVREVESHTWVQHSAFEAHVAPTTVHLTAPPPAPA
jgi:CRISPR/Cas system-associated endoribonuclease Cas2